MQLPEKSDFLAGVIEGFYGEPWTQPERTDLFERMVAWGLNTYLYAPKDDLKHRALWREPYSSEEVDVLGQLVGACNGRGIRFIYGIGPGLDIRYSKESELDMLERRFEQIMALGCQNFALLFDDIPDVMDVADAQQFPSFASAQCHVANTLLLWARERCTSVRFFFCPTPYCGRMAEAGLGGAGYLSTIGRDLLPEIEVFWTGPEIISREITVAHIRELQGILRRKPLIWDNLHANDYDGRRFFCGPYSGRPPELLNMVSGFLSNPNNEFPLNFVPLRTLAAFIRCEGRWEPREAYLAAMKEWLPYFATIGQPVNEEDLILLGDSYYLPHQEGPEAEKLYESASRLLNQSPEVLKDEFPAFQRKSARLRELCVRITELRYRRLFYALSRRTWELREELDFLERYLRFRTAGAGRQEAYVPDSHLPGTYRGGLVPRLQRLLRRKSDGTYLPEPEPQNIALS